VWQWSSQPEVLLGRVLRGLVVNNGDVWHVPCDPSLGVESSGRKLCPDTQSVPMMVASIDVVFLLGDFLFR
jgi:hypothetical protein